jgi:hypothetical protein
LSKNDNLKTFCNNFIRRQALLCLVNLGHAHSIHPSSEKDDAYLQASWKKYATQQGSDKGVDSDTLQFPQWIDLESRPHYDGKFRPVQTFEQVCNIKDVLHNNKFKLPTPSSHGHWQVDPMSNTKSNFGFNAYISPDRRQYVTAGSDQVCFNLQFKMHTQQLNPFFLAKCQITTLCVCFLCGPCQVLPLLLVTYEPRRPMDWTKLFPPLKIPKSPPFVRFRKLIHEADSSVTDANTKNVSNDDDEIWTVDVSQPLSTMTVNINEPPHLILVSESCESAVDSCGDIMREFSSVVPQDRVAALCFTQTKQGVGVKSGGFGTISSLSSLSELAKCCHSETQTIPRVESTAKGTCLGEAMLLAFDLAHQKRVKSFFDAKIQAVSRATDNISRCYEEVNTSNENGLIALSSCMPAPDSALSLMVRVPHTLFHLIAYVNDAFEQSSPECVNFEFNEKQFEEWVKLREKGREEDGRLDVANAKIKEEEETRDADSFVMVDGSDDEFSWSEVDQSMASDMLFNTIEVPILVPFLGQDHHEEACRTLHYEVSQLLKKDNESNYHSSNFANKLHQLDTFDEGMRELNKVLRDSPTMRRRNRNFHRNFHNGGEDENLCCGLDVESNSIKELFGLVAKLFPLCGNGKAIKSTIPFLQFSSKSKVKQFLNSEFCQGLEEYISGVLSYYNIVFFILRLLTS